MSIAVQEELRKYNTRLLLNNQTRWNSTLFMIISVLKLWTDELKKALSLLKGKDKDKYKNSERDMLIELKELLELFEQFTDELQGDQITISKVYPCVSGLKVNNLFKLLQFILIIIYIFYFFVCRLISRII